MTRTTAALRRLPRIARLRDREARLREAWMRARRELDEENEALARDLKLAMESYAGVPHQPADTHHPPLPLEATGTGIPVAEDEANPPGDAHHPPS